MVKCSIAKTLTMKHFTGFQDMLFYSCPVPPEEREKLDAFLLLLEKSNAWKYLNGCNTEVEPGRPKIDECKLFAAVLYCFVLGKASLREIETACSTDLRIIYLTGQVNPSASSFSRFITSLIPKLSTIFPAIMKAIFRTYSVPMNTLFLDGSKFEANANKYKFVWKPTTLHIRLSEKVANLLGLMHLGSDLPSQGIISSKLIMRKIDEAEKITPDTVAGGEKALKEMRSQLSQYFMKSLEYEEKETICGENRNSYYKTDHDATAMCLKDDYYSGLGSNMHAAYNTQILVSNGFIVSYYVSQDRSDTRTLANAIEQFHKWYGRYPEKLCADAGYGSFSNYEYCEQKGIQAFIKYPSWNGERTGRNPALYEYVDEKTITCLGFRKGVRVKLADRKHSWPNSSFFRVNDCEGCAFEPYCKRLLKIKTGKSRIFEIQPHHAQLKQQARDLLLSPEGIELRVNRSCQVEGAFGVLKQNMQYTRFRRRTLDRVTVEFALTCLGMNIRKYIRFSIKNSLPFYWKAPEDLAPETFKKPSARRIINRLKKRKKLQPNEIAKKGYKKKGKC